MRCADDESTPQEEDSTGELSQAVTSFTVAPKDVWFVRLDWPVNPETDVAGYRVWRNGVVVKTVAGRTTTTYFDPTRPTTTYSYQYSVFDIAGNESAKSAVKVVTTPAPTKTGCSVPTVATQSVVGPVQFPGDLGSGIIRLLRNSANACGGGLNPRLATPTPSLLRALSKTERPIRASSMPARINSVPRKHSKCALARPSSTTSVVRHRAAPRGSVAPRSKANSPCEGAPVECFDWRLFA